MSKYKWIKIVNFGSVINAEDELIYMTRAWDKEEIWVPDRNRTHDFPNTLRALYPLSYNNSRRAKSFNWVYVTDLLHTARITTVEVIMSSDKWIKMVNFGSVIKVKDELI